MTIVDRVVAYGDRWQRDHRWVAVTYGVVKKFGDDQGVTQTAQQAMVRVWAIPRVDAPHFWPRLMRSLTGLAVIGGAFVTNAALASFATGGHLGTAVRVLVVAGMVPVNVMLYVAALRALTPSTVPTRGLVPGAILSAVGFTFLITLGSGLVQHQVRNSSVTYGQFGIVIGLVAFLFLLAKVSLCGAELNAVLAWKLWPRALQNAHPTEADDRLTHAGTAQSSGDQDATTRAGPAGTDGTARAAGVVS